MLAKSFGEILVKIRQKKNENLKLKLVRYL